MNYFAHGRRYLESPYFLAGTAVPDWLSVVNRKVRVRSKQAAPWTADPDPRVAALARGIVQHHRDDAWFHETRAFVELNLQLSVSLREVLPEEEGHRRGFLGHIMVELLLDAELIAENPDRLRAYYAAMESLDPEVVEQAVNRMSNVGTDRLAILIPRFVAEGFLWDYADDDKLCHRVNHVLSRVRLPALPAAFRQWLPYARASVSARKDELLMGQPMPDGRRT